MISFKTSLKNKVQQRNRLARMDVKLPRRYSTTTNSRNSCSGTRASRFGFAEVNCQGTLIPYNLIDVAMGNEDHNRNNNYVVPTARQRVSET